PADRQMNAELRTIFEADQADRRSGIGLAMVARDRDRRRRVLELLAAGEVLGGPDHYHAAMVFQHGGSQQSYQRARELALRAAELGHRPGRWLAAAALDRLLVHRGQRQKYGTQYRRWGDKRMLVEVDPATTDEERAEWDVRPLAEARARAEGVIPPDPSEPVLVGGVGGGGGGAGGGLTEGSRGGGGAPAGKRGWDRCGTAGRFGWSSARAAGGCAAGTGRRRRRWGRAGGQDCHLGTKADVGGRAGAHRLER